MSEHSTDTTSVKDGPWTAGYFAWCTCSWTGEERKRHGQAVTDAARHLLVLTPKEKGTTA